MLRFCYSILIVLTGIVPAIFSFVTHLHRPVISNFQETGKIELVINKINNNKGVIRIGMYNNDAGYPDTPATGFTYAKDTLQNGLLRVSIPVSQLGTYAFSVLDDENNNGKMDYIIGIIPKEGFGFSNNPKITIKSPSFTETAFRFEGRTIKVEISMIYK